MKGTENPKVRGLRSATREELRDKRTEEERRQGSGRRFKVRGIRLEGSDGLLEERGAHTVQHEIYAPALKEEHPV